MNIVISKKIIGRVLSISILILSIYYLITNIDFHKTATILLDYNLIFLIIPIFTMFLTYFLEGVCQYVMLDSKKTPFNTFVTRILQVQLFSLFLPSRIGDSSLLILLKDESKVKLIKSYFFTKLITISVISFFSVPVIADISTVSIYLLYTLSIFLIIAIFLLYKNMKFVKILLVSVFPEKIGSKIKAMSVAESSGKKFILTFMITVVRFLIVALGNYSILVAGGMYLPYFTILSIVSVIFLITIVPTTPMGIGVVEVEMLFLYGFYGIEESSAITISVIGRLLQLINMFLFSLTLIWLPFDKDIKN